MTDQLAELFSLNFLHQAVALSVADILAALGISFLISMAIIFVYIKTFKGVMYSSSFAISLIAMNLITTLVILTVSQHWLVAVGMIGALSIVRFRTVVKEPLDLVFLYWSISAGIIVGAGFILVAGVGTIVIAAALFVFDNRKTSEIPYILIISLANEQAETASMKLISEHTKRHIIKAKTVSNENIELTVEVRLKMPSTEFVNALSNVEDVHNATLVSYNGDYYV